MNSSLTKTYFLPLRRMFYLATPTESTYYSIESIPNFVTEAVPFFFLLIIIEFLIISRKNKKYTGIDFSDGISSISAGILSQIPLFFTQSIEIISYLWIHNNYKVISVPPDSFFIWILGMIGVDFGYYWVHRASHEISLFWSGHQVHHSSQRYNLSTALRQGFFQRYFSWMFYLPLALFLPPTVFIVHLQFNLIYQFWIHTEVIDTLGILEYFFNTPSHHRVHHGRNKYCIDKNYGGTLIIFDRIFGTFQKENDEVIYGVVHPIETWHPIKIQITHFQYIFQQFIKSNNIKHTLKLLFYGPGWVPGSERLGSLNDIPDPEQPTKFYRKYISSLVFVYCLMNFLFANLLFYELSIYQKTLSMNELAIGAAALIFTLIQIGRMLDGDSVFWSECIRISISLGCVLQYLNL